MATRLKVLMSAYACEPGKGSEPEVGWQWALHMAEHHDVTVLTRTNNRAAIDAGVALLQGKRPLPHFVYHDRHPGLLNLKRRFNAVKLYYILWQKSAREVVHHLHLEHRFDVMHHVTFAGYRYPTALWGHGAPVIWGPIGGIESIPWRLLPWRHFGSLVTEAVRNANNLVQGVPFHVLPKRARASTLLLVSTPEMERSFARLGFKAELMPTIGLAPEEIPFRPHEPRQGPLRLLFVGSIITLKGVDLALRAVAESGADAVFTLVGSGNYERAAVRQAEALGIKDRVRFLGRRPRTEVLGLYPEHDLFLFPSLHDTGGYALIEAMFNRLPVICIDCGGPAVAVQPGCGVKVPLGSRTEVVRRLASAIRDYARNRSLLSEHGEAARERIVSGYAWNKKALEMSRCYEKAVALGATRKGSKGFSGMGGVANLLHEMFSFRGILLTSLVLVLIGALGFLSLAHLKTEARLIVEDTLPGLYLAGEANASLAQGFNRTMLLIMMTEPREREKMQGEIESYSETTRERLEDYRGQIFNSDDAVLFKRWLDSREAYLGVRRSVLAVLKTNQAGAIEICRHELLPAYGRYKEAGDQVFGYNMRQGKSRGEGIMAICTATEWLVAGIGVVVFLLGFLFGFFR